MPFIEPAENQADAADRHQEITQLADLRGNAQVRSPVGCREDGREEPRLPQKAQPFFGRGVMPVRRDRVARRVHESAVERV